ncbi:hypothetical protein K438DRAFT_1772213 [Mycena galopus ATCC 62051]|nr:hypothetical protein K438DRAFT_1772213 [Mycena galopus ATCC 62051]
MSCRRLGGPNCAIALPRGWKIFWMWESIMDGTIDTLCKAAQSHMRHHAAFVSLSMICRRVLWKLLVLIRHQVGGASAGNGPFWQRYSHSRTAAVEKPNNDVKMMHIMIDVILNFASLLPVTRQSWWDIYLALLNRFHALDDIYNIPAQWGYALTMARDDYAKEINRIATELEAPAMETL